MPMPQPTKVEDLSVSGKTPKSLDVKVIKPYKKDIPDIHLRLVELAFLAKKAKKAKKAKNTEGEK